MGFLFRFTKVLVCRRVHLVDPLSKEKTQAFPCVTSLRTANARTLGLGVKITLLFTDTAQRTAREAFRVSTDRRRLSARQGQSVHVWSVCVCFFCCVCCLLSAPVSSEFSRTIAGKQEEREIEKARATGTVPGAGADTVHTVCQGGRAASGLMTSNVTKCFHRTLTLLPPLPPTRWLIPKQSF